MRPRLTPEVVPPDGGRTPHPTIADETIAVALLDRLDRSAVGATVCPSDVARALAGDPVVWRALMPRIRAVAGRLAAEGRIRVTRRGLEVDATSPGGPIRLSRPAHDPSR